MSQRLPIPNLLVIRAKAQFIGAPPKRQILMETALGAAPSMVLLATGSPRYAALYLFAFTVLALIRHFLRQDVFSYLALLTALTPSLMLLRDLFSYSSVILLLATGSAVWLLIRPDATYQLVANRVLCVLFLMGVLYYIASVLFVKHYAANIRVLELIFSATNIYFLGRSRSFLATAMLGLSISAFSISIAMIPYGDRLGMAQVDGHTIGNPMALGMPLALIFLLAIADCGRWLVRSSRLFISILLHLTAAAFLLMSTSRGSWLVAAIGLLAIFLLNPANRRRICITLTATALVVCVLLSTSRGEVVLRYLEKATASNRSLEQKTSGRWEQWEVIPSVIADSPIWGFGPGSGRAVNSAYTGVGRTWHSLYLQIVADTGLTGLTLLFCLLFALSLRAFNHWHVTGECVPVLGILGFCTIGLSVSAMDAISGVYLGVACLATDFSQFYLVSDSPLQHTLITVQSSQ